MLFYIMKVHKFWGELTDISAKSKSLATSGDYLSELHTIVLGYFDPINVKVLEMLNSFWGDKTNIY